MRNLTYLICSLLLFLSFLAQAQRPINPDSGELVYPIKQNHKTGFILIKEYGSIPMIDPIYDYIADTYLPWNTTLPTLTDSPYRLFQIDEKVGLLDSLLQEVIPNKYNRIRPVCDNYFAVEIDSLFALIDENGTIINPGPYQNICSADPIGEQEPSFLFVQQDNRWGLSTLKGELLLDYQFADIQSAGKSGFYKVKRKYDAAWELIDNSGKPLLMNTYDDILVLDKDLFAVKEIHWSLFVKKKNTPNARLSLQERNQFAEIRKLNDVLFAIRRVDIEKPIVELWHIEKQEKLRSYEAVEIKEGDFLPKFKPLDDRYFIRIDVNDNDKSRPYEYLMDNQGTNMSNPYQQIFPTNKDYVYQGGFENTGARFTGSNADTWMYTLLTPLFPSASVSFGEKGKIYPFLNDLVLTAYNGKYGLIYLSEDGQSDKLEDVYTYVDILDDKTIHVQLKEQNIRYALVNGKFEEQLIIETRAIPKNRIPKIKEAGVAKKANGSAEIPEPIYFQSGFIKYQLEPDPKGQRLVRNYMEDIRRNVQEEKTETYFTIPNKTPYKGVSELSKDLVALFEANTVPAAIPFGNSVLDGEPKRIQVASAASNNLVPTPDIIGIRKFDEFGDAAAFIDVNGQMGLLNKNGQQINKNGRPLRFTYIGPFFDGIAVACTGGRLTLDRNGTEKRGPALKALIDFKVEFQIKALTKNGKISNTNKDKKIHLIHSETKPVQWMYINTNGETLFEVDAYYAHDFDVYDQTAQFDQRLEKKFTNGIVSKVKRTGLLNKAGRSILEPIYSQITKYPDFYLVSKKGTPTFSFNAKGHQIRKNPTRLRPFSENFAVFRNEENLWGYINNEGEVVIEAQFQKARPFSEGRALVMNDSGEYVFIDTKGEPVFSTGISGEHLWQMLGDFKEGRCWFKEKGGNFKWGAYDPYGKIVIEPRFYYKPKGRANIEQIQRMPMDFSNGVAAVHVVIAGEQRAGIIDTMGNFIVEPSDIYRINRFDNQGFATFQKKEKGAYGLIDSAGTMLVPPKYQKIEGFVNGYSRVLSPEEKWGLINTAGKERIPTQYTAVDTLSEGLVAVKPLNKGWHFVDEHNRTKIKGPFKTVQEFKNGITLVEMDKEQLIINNKADIVHLKLGKPIFFSSGILGVQVGTGKKAYYYYADAMGNNLFGRYFTAIAPFNLKSAKVKADSPVYKSKRYYGAINKRGVMVVPSKFNTLHFQPDGNIIINPQVYKGIMSKSGEEILAAQYDQILPMEPYVGRNNALTQNNNISVEEDPIILRVEDGEKIGYFHFKNGEVSEIWELQN